MRGWTIGGLLLLSLGAALAWAGGRPRPIEDPVWSNDRSFVVEFAPEPAEVPLNERFSAEVGVFVRPEDDELVSAMQLSVDARMPQHRHGMRVEPTVTRIADGRWRVEGLLLHMPGRWELYFDVTRGAVTERAQMVLELE